MAVSTPSKEIAEIEFKRIVSVTWPSLAVLYSVQVLASQSSINSWQLYYVSGIAISAFLSGVIWKLSKSAYSFSPIVMYMLVAPLVLGSIAEKPWMSYGLLTVGANMYFSSINPWQASLAVMVSVTALQSWVISHNFSSITDTDDMRLLGTYFSTLWTLGIGVMMLVIRSRYLTAVEKVDDRIDLLKNQISNRLHGISKRNREDFRNLKLHGTVLNTLIFARNNLRNEQEKEILLKTLRSEISDLEDSSGKLSANFQQVVRDEIAKRSSSRTVIEILELQVSISDEKLQNIYLEIIREVLLNIEKHTVATAITLSVRERVNGEIYISITENSPSISEIKDFEGYLRQSSSSLSLRRLLSSAPADLNVSYDAMSQKVIFEIYPRDSSGALATSNEIYKLRNESLLEFSINFARAISIVGLFFLPGYFLVGERGTNLLVLSLQVLALIANVFYGVASKKLLGISILLSLITPLYLSSSVESCSQVQYFPWLINIVMVSAFSFALLYKNRVLRWLPLGILTLQMIVLPLGYPNGCRTIFIGSLPGIPLILVFSMVIATLRKRAVEQDSMQIRAAFEDEKNINEVEEKLNLEYNQLLQNLKLFTAKLDRAKTGEQAGLIDSQIQQIRAFLICSEQFESKIVRDFYHFAKNRLNNGFSTRISMIGDNFFELDSSLDLIQYFKRLDKYLGETPSEIALIRIGLLSTEIAVPDESLTSISGYTSELSRDYPEIKLSLRAM